MYPRTPRDRKATWNLTAPLWPVWLEARSAQKKTYIHPPNGCEATVVVNANTLCINSEILQKNGIAKFSAPLLWDGIWLAVLVQYDMKGRIGYGERRGLERSM